MGRYLLGGKEARLPYEVEELNLRLYTVEELCYYIYNNLSLIEEDFIDERLLTFLRKELGQTEIADKIERFYVSPSDQDSTLLMLLADVGYYSEQELKEFQNRLVSRKRKNGPERILQKADSLYAKKRYLKAVYYYRRIAADHEDGRITGEQRSRAYEAMANAYGHLFAFDRAKSALINAYEENPQERLLKKIYEVSSMSGTALPEKLFSNAPETLLAAWEQEFRSKAAMKRIQAEDHEIMRSFFLEDPEGTNRLKQYVDAEKELYRTMVE